jgi:hypothetical protein
MFPTETQRRHKVYLGSGAQSVPETAEFPGAQSVPTGPGSQSVPTIDTLTREANEVMHPKLDRSCPKPKLIWSNDKEIDRNDEWQRYCDSLPLFTSSLPATAFAAAA